jgi:hypothetical protein
VIACQFIHAPGLAHSQAVTKQKILLVIQAFRKGISKMIFCPAFSPVDYRAKVFSSAVQLAFDVGEADAILSPIVATIFNFI